MRDPGHMQLLAEGLEAQAEKLQQAFSTARPFRHVVIDDFFAPEFAQQLEAAFPAFDPKLAINENGEVGGKAVHERITTLGPRWQQLDALVKSEAFRAWVGAVTGIDDLQYDPYYFGGGTHENLYGQSLDAHIDFNYHPVTRQHRRLNLIVYLTREWEDSWGGSIQLHRDPYLPPAQDEIVTVTPAFNRCVIFETNEYSWHGFPRIAQPADKRHISRRSFALYYYTDTRPAEDTGPEHSTIYVDEHLPETYQPGMVLDDASLQHIRDLMTRRDHHLKRLYGNIKQLYTELNQLKGVLAAEPPSVPDTGAEASDAGQHVATLEARLRQMKLRVHELESSTSWRLTRPLRRLKRWISRQPR